MNLRSDDDQATPLRSRVTTYGGSEHKPSAAGEMLKGFLVVLLWALYLGFLFVCIGAFMRFKWSLFSSTPVEWSWSLLLWAVSGLSAIVILHWCINKITDRIDAKRPRQQQDRHSR